MNSDIMSRSTVTLVAFVSKSIKRKVLNCIFCITCKFLKKVTFSKFSPYMYRISLNKRHGYYSFH